MEGDFRDADASGPAPRPGWLGRFGLRLPWWVGRPAGGPPWAWRVAVGVTGTLMLVPVLLVIAAVLVAVLAAILAIMVGMLTYVVASAIARVLNLPGRAANPTTLPDDGRRNVRVLHPEETSRG